ncbi:MAG: hypothetical protein JSU96_09165 [Acidobacteriota bacterium]|nr:MAG: hypothetical protein JSU96_09165 [Acidobacteriota bacterium]
MENKNTTTRTEVLSAIAIAAAKLAEIDFNDDDAVYEALDSAVSEACGPLGSNAHGNLVNTIGAHFDAIARELNS